MPAIDRRFLLKQILPGAIAAAGVASVGLSFVPRPAEAIPVASDKTNLLKIPEPAEKAQVVVVGPRRRRRGRRWVCWWRRGRRVCGWRYW